MPDSAIIDVSVEPMLTDHHAITWGLVSIKPQPLQKTIVYHNYSATDKNMFARDLRDLPFLINPADDIDSL